MGLKALKALKALKVLIVEILSRIGYVMLSYLSYNAILYLTLGWQLEYSASLVSSTLKGDYDYVESLLFENNVFISDCISANSLQHSSVCMQKMWLTTVANVLSNSLINSLIYKEKFYYIILLVLFQMNSFFKCSKTLSESLAYRVSYFYCFFIGLIVLIDCLLLISCLLAEMSIETVDIE
jgi:hypothetical protein